MKLQFDMDPITGNIIGNATNKLGEGGNFAPRRRDRKRFAFASLGGKATEGSTIGKVNDFVRFAIVDDPSQVDRSELSARDNYKFGTILNIDIEFRVRGNNYDTVTGYLLQFWQPVVSPIAGLRLNDGRLEVVSRSSGGAYSSPLKRNTWYDWTIQLKAGKNGFIKVFDDKSDKLLGARYGLINAGSQAGQTREDVVRPKFGFYGTAGTGIVVDYRDFVISIV